jgi:hypothetical protein
MIGLLCFVLAVLASPFKSKLRLEAENAVLRHPLIVLRRRPHSRIRLTNHDRWFFIQLYRRFPAIRKVLTIIRPETLVRWHRAGFRCYWRWKSRPRGGRPQIDTELRELIRRMSVENPLWGAPRIHGELLKLGFEIAQSSVAKYMVERRGPPSQGWRTFLRNHAPDIAAMDLFVVPTVGFDLLYRPSRPTGVHEGVQPGRQAANVQRQRPGNRTRDLDRPARGKNREQRIPKRNSGAQLGARRHLIVRAPARHALQRRDPGRCADELQRDRLALSFADPGVGADPDIDITRLPTGGPEIRIRLLAAVAQLKIGPPVPGVEPPLHLRARDERPKQQHDNSDRRQPCQTISRNSAKVLANAHCCCSKRSS